MIHIVLADDDAIIREGLRMILETQDDFALDAVCTNGREALECCRESRPDVVLLDIRMPEMNGIDAAKIMIEEQLGNPLLLTTFDEPELIVNAVKAKVNGYILKSASADTIISAIRTVALGEAVFQKDVLEYITSQIGIPTCKSDLFLELTEREHEVAALIAKGFSNKKIGEILYLSDGTVRNHISSILSKTGLEHRTQIAIYYVRM